MERAANESVSNVDNSEEGESTSSSSAEPDHQQPASTQTHSVVCWNIQCPDCPSPIARITPWPRPAPPAPRQLTPEDRRAAFALASLRGADPVSSEEITRATGTRGSLVAQAAEAQRQGRPIGEREIHRSSTGERLAAGTPPTPPQRRFSSFIAPRSSTPRPPPTANRTVSPPPPFAYQPPASPTPSITADPFEDRPVHRPLSLSDARLRTRNLLLRSASTAASILADVVLRSAFPQWERWFVGVRTERNAIVRAVNLYQRAKVEAKILLLLRLLHRRRVRRNILSDSASGGPPYYARPSSKSLQSPPLRSVGTGRFRDRHSRSLPLGTSRYLRLSSSSCQRRVPSRQEELNGFSTASSIVGSRF
jgi:hypothetical protein